MVKVSVIVPVYNGEKHLEECLDSICGQTLKEIEILCVDDGSTDSSYEILKRYQEKDARIHLFRQQNLYAGVARNLGKSHAMGEYLAFWDCDDFFELDALEKLYNKAKSVDADVCVCGGNQYLESKKALYPSPSYLNMKRVPETDTFNRFTNPEHYLDFTNAAAWNKLFRREFVEQLELDFQPIRNGNDAYFTVNAIGLAERITVLNEKLVNYRVNQSDGLVCSLSKSPLSPIQAWLDIAQNLSKYDGFGERSFANKALGSMIYTLQNVADWEAFHQAITKLQEGALREMYIVPQPEGYYYGRGKGAFVNHLYADTPEEFAIFLSHTMYQERTEYVAEKRKLKSQNARLRKKNRLLREEVASKQVEIMEKERGLTGNYSKLAKKNAASEKELCEAKESWAYHVERVFLWLPDKIRCFFRENET